MGESSKSLCCSPPAAASAAARARTPRSLRASDRAVVPDTEHTALPSPSRFWSPPGIGCPARA
eukprot:8985977-Alexandrium_andersonii.AAC.1